MEAYDDSAPRAARDPYDALDAFLLEHAFCRPGLDDPHIRRKSSRSVVAVAPLS